MHRDQRGGARGVKGEGGTLKAEQVGDAAGQDARQRTSDLMALRVVRLRRADRVVLVARADERAGAAAPQGVRVEPGALERLPRGLKKYSLLRVHRQRLAVARMPA